VGTPLRLLLIEDSEENARLIIQELFHHGYELSYERVSTCAATSEALDRGEWDLIIAEYAMPQFNGLDALELVQGRGLDVPFIILSGAVGEGVAVEVMKAGAHDYLMKGDLMRLIPAIERELRESEVRRERKQAEAALLQKEEYFQSLIENSSDIITVIDGRGVILYDSPSVDRVLGYRQNELVGTLIFDYVHPDDLPHLKDVVMKGAQEVGKTLTVEFRFRRRDGLWRLLESLGRGYRNSAGEIVGIINSRDVTERKQAEEQLRRANAQLLNRERELLQALGALKQSHEALKTTQLQLLQAAKLESVGRLAAGVAHEVKNPLAIILLGTEYLANRLTSIDEKTREVLRDIDAAIKRADSIIIGLLDFSSSQAIRLSVQDFNAIVEQSLLLLKYELDKYRITVAKSLEASLPPLKLDQQKIEQALVNLFLNAIHAMPEGGTLSVKTYLAHAEKPDPFVGARETDRFSVGEPVVMAEIEDTGSGIPDAYLSRIFDPFFTGRPTGKGTGLGLTVTRHIIDLHGGMIHIRNREGRGVIVAIALRI